MDTQEPTTNWMQTASTPLPEWNHTTPTPTPKTSRPWARAVAGAAAAVALLVVGGAIGFVVADDSDEVEELQAAVEDQQDDIDDLEDRVSESGARLSAADAALDLCIRAAESTQSLVDDVETLALAHDAFMVAPVGSQAEMESWFEYDNAFAATVGSGRSVEVATVDCLAEDEE